MDRQTPSRVCHGSCTGPTRRRPRGRASPGPTGGGRRPLEPRPTDVGIRGVPVSVPVYFYPTPGLGRPSSPVHPWSTVPSGPPPSTREGPRGPYPGEKMTRLTRRSTDTFQGRGSHQSGPGPDFSPLGQWGRRVGMDGEEPRAERHGREGGRTPSFDTTRGPLPSFSSSRVGRRGRGKGGVGGHPSPVLLRALGGVREWFPDDRGGFCPCRWTVDRRHRRYRSWAPPSLVPPGLSPLRPHVSRHGWGWSRSGHSVPCPRSLRPRTECQCESVE